MSDLAGLIYRDVSARKHLLATGNGINYRLAPAITFYRKGGGEAVWVIVVVAPGADAGYAVGGNPAVVIGVPAISGLVARAALNACHPP